MNISQNIILKRENQVILLMITDSKKWHYLTLKILPILVRGITPKHVWDFYCLNCFHWYSTEKNLKKHYNVYKNHDYCYGEMTKEDNKILKYNHGENLMKIPFIIFIQ